MFGAGDRAVAAAPDWLTPGRLVGLEGHTGFGLTRLALSLLAEPARRGWVACVDARGWLCPAAAWEVGVPAERLVVVHCSDRKLWPQVTAALMEGMGSVYAEIPAGVPDQMLRRLAALARSRRTAVLLRPLRGSLPSGLTHTRLVAQEVAWEGPDAGHGRLQHRRMVLEASGKGTGGIPTIFEVNDDGTDAVHLVPRLAAAAAGRAAG